MHHATFRRSFVSLLLLPIVIWSEPTYAQTQAQASTARPVANTTSSRKVLTIEDYARWRSIDANRISGDGNYVVYGLRHGNALDPKPVLHVLRLADNHLEQIPNATQPALSDDSRWVAYFVELPFEEARKLREGSRPVTRKAQLMDLRTGVKRTWDDVQSFAFARGSRHLLVRRRQQDARAKHRGVDALLHDLRSGADQLLGSVNEASFNRSGDLLAYTVDAVQRDANGLVVLDLRNGRAHPLDDDTLTYSRLTWNENGTALAVLKGNDASGKREKVNSLLAFPDVNAALAATTKPIPALLTSATAGLPAEWVVSEKRELQWSANGRLVFVGTKEQRAAVDTMELKKGTDELADVDVWNTKDLRIQSVQISRADADRSFTYRGAFDVGTGRFITLADSTIREIELTADGRWAIGRDERAYISDYERPSADLYRINTATGERTLIARKQITGSNGTHLFGTSPDGRFFLYWRDNQFQLYNLDAGTSTALIKQSDLSFVNQEFDHPGPRPPYGVGGWTKDGKGVVLLHRYDMWLAPLDGNAPKNLTGGAGAKDDIRFRYSNPRSTEGMGPVERAQALAIDLSKPQLLSAYGQWTKQSGFYEQRNGQVKPLVYEAASFSSPTKAAAADRYLFTRESFTEFPDLRVAGPDLQASRKITDVNPQQADFAWGRRMLVDYTNSKGVRLQAVLTLPDDYRPGEKRPMLVQFYEKMSQNLHRHAAPSFMGSMNSIPTEAVSRGYLTLHPDVHFNTRTSHSDMLECVEAATRKVIELGYADPARIGVQGHSYSGQGVAFIGTRSKLFAAIGMGAGVSDMTSDFSHNWGWSYQVQGRDGSNAIEYYLYTQGRQATNPWDDPELYRFESGRTHVREAVAPFLIMHGTADVTVAFQEALGFYNALRFNGKSAVLLAYPGEGHGLRGLANRRDLTIRYFQFFDHYLRGAPAARWMTEGVPFLEKDLRRDAAKDAANVSSTSQGRRN